jgi:hypothetical protein
VGTNPVSKRHRSHRQLYKKLRGEKREALNNSSHRSRRGPSQESRRSAGSLGTRTKEGNSDVTTENEREGRGGEGRGGGGQEGTYEIAGDRVRGVGGDRMGEAGQEAEEGDEPEITRETNRNISRGSKGRSSLVEVAVQVATIRALGGSCSRRGKASKGEPWLPTCRGVPPDAERRLPVPAVWLRFQYCRLGDFDTQAIKKMRWTEKPLKSLAGHQATEPFFFTPNPFRP